MSYVRFLSPFQHKLSNIKSKQGKLDVEGHILFFSKLMGHNTTIFFQSWWVTIRLITRLFFILKIKTDPLGVNDS